MRITKVFTEANVAAKIKDPKVIKMLGIAMRHDGTLPRSKIASLGPKPEDQQILKLWSDILDASLRTTDYGDISADGKFDDWLTRLYMNGAVDYEDINGEGGDALGAWKALSTRNRLQPAHQDFNKFKNLAQIQKIVRSPDYRGELARIKDSEVIEKHKRERKEIVLIDNERYNVVIPLNYGACYTFNNAAGYQSNFCTGSSSGLSWFKNYAPGGPIISVTDKSNMGTNEGKWQIHAATNQIVDSDQTRRHDVSWNDDRFANLFPGLMKKIGNAMQSKADDIKTASVEITGTGEGYDIGKAISDLQKKYPQSWASEADSAEEDNDGPGTYLVTHGPSGRTARIEGDNKQDVKDKLQARHPNANLDDFTFERQPDQQENMLY
jgi:hypothetical protein